MMNLADIDRPIKTIYFTPLSRDVKFRPLSAQQLCDLEPKYASLQGESSSTPEMLNLFADLLAMCVIDPKASAEEWLAAARGTTILKLGEIVARESGIYGSEDTAKN